MPCTAEFRDDQGLVLSGFGVVTGNELIDVNRSLVCDRIKSLRYVIVDLTPATELHVATLDIRAIVEEDRRLAALAPRRLPVAIATSSNLGFGLARMWETFVGDVTEWQTALFRSRKEAESWVQVMTERSSCGRE
jgi:hypothetical protein